MHDSRVFEEILDEGNGGKGYGVWADSAYGEMEGKLRDKGRRTMTWKGDL